MTNMVNALYHVNYNPFKYGEYIVSFYENLVGVESNYLLLQLVIPLCSHPLFSSKIENAVFGEKRTSTIWTIFNDRTELYDLQERIDGLKELADLSLQYCLVNDWLEVDEQILSISSLPKSDASPNAHKSAANLARLLSSLSVVEIYSLLGVKPR